MIHPAYLMIASGIWALACILGWMAYQLLHSKRVLLLHRDAARHNKRWSDHWRNCAEDMTARCMVQAKRADDWQREAQMYHRAFGDEKKANHELAAKLAPFVRKRGVGGRFVG